MDKALKVCLVPSVIHCRSELFLFVKSGQGCGRDTRSLVSHFCFLMETILGDARTPGLSLLGQVTSALCPFWFKTHLPQEMPVITRLSRQQKGNFK